MRTACLPKQYQAKGFGSMPGIMQARQIMSVTLPAVKFRMTGLKEYWPINKLRSMKNTGEIQVLPYQL
jgi:hypothetical protein